MPKGVRGTRDFFKERYGLGDRLAVRLAALVACKVELTAAAIECLSDSPALQHAILHPELLEAAGSLDTETLRARVLPGEQLPASFIVAEQGGWRTVALEEELLAEQGAHADTPTDNLPVLGGKAEVLHPGEIADLFSRRDIAELELTLRTSADAKEKVTAIRRLKLSPASDREKVTLFATALTDHDAQVRSEAADALTTLGLSPEVADDARALAEGNDRRKRFAAQRLGSRITRAADPAAPLGADVEMGVILRIVAGTLRYEPSLEVRRLLIRAVEGACRAVAADPRSTHDLVHMLLGQLRDAIEDLGTEVRRVLLILGRLNPDELYRMLQQELGSVVDHPTRSLLIATAGELASSDEHRTEVCEQAIREFETSDDPAVECLPLANMLAGFGDTAVRAIEPCLTTAPEAAQDAFVRLLDVVATRRDTPKATRARIGGLLLTALQHGERAARQAVIQATATADTAVPAKVRSGLAAELLACLQEYANPGIIDAIEATVAHLGAPAVGPALDVLDGEGKPRPRISAARVLGQLVPDLDARHTALARQAIDRTLALLDASFPDRPALARALGQMCAGPAADEPTVARVAAELRTRVLDKPLANAALDGLASLCPSPHVAPTLKVDLASFFARLLEHDLPDIEDRSQAAADETVYTLGGEVTAYTELVPTLIAGLQNIATTATATLRTQALDSLLHAWRGIANGDLQLGPGNTERLLDALRAIGTQDCADADERATIADAVALRRDFMPVYRVLADLCVGGGETMADRAVALADALLEREANDRHLTDSERVEHLAILAHLVAHAALGTHAQRLHQRTIGTVLDADKREVEGIDDIIRQLHGAPGIPAALKKRLAARITAAQ